MAEDDASIQILEPDADQQYIPERRERSTKPKTLQKPVDSNWQKPPLLIVEKKVVQPNTAPLPEKAQEKEDETTARIVNIVGEQQRKTDDTWKTQVGDVVWFIIRFFVMAFFSFIILVLLNPPFVQEPLQQQLFGETPLTDMQRRSASLSRAAAWATGAGVAFVILPPIWGVLSSRFFPNDIMMAMGLKH